MIVRDANLPASLSILSLDARSLQVRQIGYPRLASAATDSIRAMDTAGFDSQGRLLAAYVRVANDLVTQTQTITYHVLSGMNSTRVISMDEMTARLLPRQADLVTLVHYPGWDTALGARVNMADAVDAGMLISVTARAYNKGDYTEEPNQLTVEFYVGDPDAGGQMVRSVVITQALPSGSWMDVVHGFVLSATEQLTLGVRLVRQGGDPRPSNNTVLLPLRFSFPPKVKQLHGINLTKTSEGEPYGAFAFALSSSGFVTSSASVMTVTLSQTDVLSTRAVPVPRIAPGVTEVLTVTMPMGGLRTGTYTLTAELQGGKRFVSVQRTAVDLVLEDVWWTDLSFAPVVVHARVRNNSWFTASAVALSARDGSGDGEGLLVPRENEHVVLGDLAPGASVTMVLALARPQVCEFILSVSSRDADDPAPDNNRVSSINARLCLRASIQATPIGTLTPTGELAGAAPMRVILTGTSNFANAQWLWDLGNGVTSTTQYPGVHTYTQAGLYEVRAAVTDPESGAQVRASQFVMVYSPTVPLFDCNGCDAVQLGNPIVLENTSQGKIKDLWWDFGDGSITVTGGLVEYTYPAPGVYTITLAVQGIEGDWRTATRRVTVTGAHLTPKAYLPMVMRSTPSATRRVYLPHVLKLR